MEERISKIEEKLLNAIIWNKVFKWMMGLGLFAYLIIAGLHLWETKKLTSEFQHFQQRIARKMDLMDVTMQLNAVRDNEVREKIGLDKINTSPFNAPTYEDLTNK